MPLSSCSQPPAKPHNPLQPAEPVRSRQSQAPSVTVLNRTSSVSLRRRHSSSIGMPKSTYQNEQKISGQNAPRPSQTRANTIVSPAVSPPTTCCTVATVAKVPPARQIRAMNKE